MKSSIKVPQMGESISEAHIGQIFKPTGSVVKQDDEILELETDKVNQVLYAPAAGVVTLSVKAEDKVTIGQEIGFVDADQGEAKSETPAVPKAEMPKEVGEVDPKAEGNPDEKIALDPPKPITPKVEPQEEKKSQASSLEESIRRTKEDFAASLDQPEKPIEKKSEPQVTSAATAVAEKGEVRKKMSRLRQTIATKLVEASTKTAMLTTFNEVDLTEVIGLRERYKEAFQKKFDIKLGFLPFFVLATVAALKEFPLLNSSIDGDEVVEREHVDMGVAVSTDKGLIVPIIKNAESKSFVDIERAVDALSKKAREGSLTMDDIKGGTFTITNGGTFGSLLSTPILNFPQTGILGMHKIQKRAVVIDDEIKIRSMMYLALTYDHRLIDGKEAVQFLVHIKNLLEDPGRFLIGL